MVEDQSAARRNFNRVTFGELFMIFVVTALVAGLGLQYLGIFKRFELQTINHRFEARQWIKWNPKSLGRLNPLTLIDYHEKNEIPKTWWSWDYTLSWLIGDNHPTPALKYVIFNRALEDEPPLEAAKSHSWMKPLLRYPLPRETLSEMVNFVAASGARAIVLDYDFPQYTDGDKELAQAIFQARLNVSAKPVFIANSIHAVTASNISEVQQPVTRSGVIRELEQLEPEANVVDKYTGLTGVLQDEDQIIRRLVLKLRLQDGKEFDALVVKLLRSLDVKLSPSTPEVIDIDFISVPNSNIFPIRPLSYLLDPELKAKISSGGSDDVSLKDAIVLIGDGISDVYDTPLTNLSANRRSGTELLAQGIDTLARQSWLYRITAPQEYIYIAFMAIIGGLNFVAFRYFTSPNRDVARDYRSRRGLAVGTDVGLFVTSLLSVYVFANGLFSFAGMIVPLVVPGLAITLATLVTVFWERDRLKVISMAETIQSSQEKLVLAQEKHEAQLAYQAILADQRSLEDDRSRRHDMVRRLNHDLKAPISVFNWTLAKVLKDRAEDDPMFAVFQRLKRSSEHLSNLLSEIVQSLEERSLDGQKTQICEITSVLIQQMELERSLGEITGSEVVLKLPENSELTWVVGTELEVARIVDNIVGNALKHNPAGTRVEITMPPVQWNDEDLIVTIQDNGKGIARADLDRIFQTGFRVAGTRPEGQGLGLSIATSLVAKIGGKISVSSELGIGTKFDITFQRYKSTLDATADIRLDNVRFSSEKLTEASKEASTEDDDWSLKTDSNPLDQSAPQSDPQDRKAHRSIPRG